MTHNEKTFIKHVKNKCKEHNVKLILKNTKKIKIWEKTYVGGYFNDISTTKGELVCAAKHSEYLNLLVHEFSHMEQWIEKTPLWENTDTGAVDEWLNGKNIKFIKNKIDKIKYMELDCEKRAVKNIKKHNLSVNIETYIQKANSYILFYNYLKETRQWSKPGNAPYSLKNKELWSLCPTKFMPDSYYEKIPKRIYKKFVELGI